MKIWFGAVAGLYRTGACVTNRYCAHHLRFDTPIVGVPMVIMIRQKALEINVLYDLLTPRHVVRDGGFLLIKGE